MSHIVKKMLKGLRYLKAIVQLLHNIIIKTGVLSFALNWLFNMNYYKEQIFPSATVDDVHKSCYIKKTLNSWVSFCDLNKHTLKKITNLLGSG